MLKKFLQDVTRFNQEILGIEIPSKPTILKGPRAEHAVEHLQEELDEFKLSLQSPYDITGSADALIDLIYVALGRLMEMGIAPGPVFDEVHRANMAKERGEVSKRPNSLGHDAIKPEGWTPPDLEKVLQVSLKDIEGISPIFLKASRLRAKKDKDYNSGPVLEDYFPFGHQSYVQMIHVKTLRLLSLLAVDASGKTYNFESIEDNIEDLVNYASYYGEWLASEKLKDDGE